MRKWMIFLVLLIVLIPNFAFARRAEVTIRRLGVASLLGYVPDKETLRLKVAQYQDRIYQAFAMQGYASDVAKQFIDKINSGDFRKTTLLDYYKRRCVQMPAMYWYGYNRAGQLGVHALRNIILNTGQNEEFWLVYLDIIWKNQFKTIDLAIPIKCGNLAWIREYQQDLPPTTTFDIPEIPSELPPPEMKLTLLERSNIKEGGEAIYLGTLTGSLGFRVAYRGHKETKVNYKLNGGKAGKAGSANGGKGGNTGGSTATITSGSSTHSTGGTSGGSHTSTSTTTTSDTSASGAATTGSSGPGSGASGSGTAAAGSSAAAAASAGTGPSTGGDADASQSGSAAVQIGPSEGGEGGYSTGGEGGEGGNVEYEIVESYDIWF